MYSYKHYYRIIVIENYGIVIIITLIVIIIHHYCNHLIVIITIMVTFATFLSEIQYHHLDPSIKIDHTVIGYSSVSNIDKSCNNERASNIDRGRNSYLMNDW
jgi:hypothetical protein